MFIEKETKEISLEDVNEYLKTGDLYGINLSNTEFLKRLRPYVMTTKNKNSWLEIMTANIND